ncbi:trypsin-like serine peptidase [Thiothrix subterranea]|uniref:trypsin-like serine peptidase n=1 Tax=Thiothrix subterranea TaxID=2735563 RepID=UPI00192B10EB|nr:trypsin-like serine protease [Thiothrix subterranea]
MKGLSYVLLCGSFVVTSSALAGEVVSVDKKGSLAVAKLGSKDSALDYANAKPIPLPEASNRPSRSLPVTGGAADLAPKKSRVIPGGMGDGKETPVQLFTDKVGDQGMGMSLDSPGYGYEYSEDILPFSTSRVDIQKVKPAHPTQLSKSYPYSAAGKLFFKVDGDTYVCSASLIRPGLVVTAAHCVAGFGEDRFYDNFEFIPAYYNGKAPYGKWTAEDVVVFSSYLQGTANCIDGVVCDNDIAVMQMKPAGKTYPGNKAGWYGIGVDGYSYLDGIVQITQLGYPVSHDQGKLMQRTDSVGIVDSDNIDNTYIGSRQTGGSSGGPWLVNFGQVASLGQGINVGYDAWSNVVVGVTSWGWGNGNVYKAQGASPFTSDNILPLVDWFCPEGDTSKLCK